MRIAAVIVLAAAVVMPAAEAAPVDELFQQFGLFGTWAPDCGQAGLAGQSACQHYDAERGTGARGPRSRLRFAVNRYSMLSAERLSDERLSVEAIFQPGNDAEDHEQLIFLVRGRTRRTIFNQPDGGAARVKDGIALPGGSKTPVLNKCD